MKPRRWPYITSALIVVIVLLFLITHDRLQREANQYREIESRTLSLATVHPKTPVTGAQQRLIDSFRRQHPKDWELMTSLRDASATLDEMTDEMKELAQELDDFQRDSITAQFAVYPPRRSLLSYLTANFLHRSWVHLIFNICFLWLVGGVLEDVWGRRIYSCILLVSGVMGVWSYALVYRVGLAPLVGASDLIAVLIGFYVIRFPKTAIERGTAIWVIRPHFLRFSSPVYTVFPMWILGLMFWGKLADETSLKGFLALGFAFALGMAPALLLRFTGIEDYVTQKVEAEVGWSVDPHIATASDFLQKGNLDAAINEVNAQIAEKPSSTEARELLVNLYSRKGEIGLKYCQALEGVCEVHLQAANPEAAWMHYENYLKAGGRKMPAATWFQLARFAENHGDSQRALSEYEEFAKAWPNERSAVLALMSAGRIQFQSGRWEEATQLYTAAQTSSVPHREWDDLIRKGLQKVGDVAKPAVETISSGLRQPGSG